MQTISLKAALAGGALFTDLAEQYGVSRKTFYQYFSPDGELRELAKNILSD